MSPLTNVIWTIIVSPLFAISRQPWVVILHSEKRTTRGWPDIRVTAKVLHYSFTRAVSGRGHMERASLFFTAVESQLSKRQMPSQLIHRACREKHLLAAYFTEWRLDWQLRGRSWAVHHNVGNKKPTSWSRVTKNIVVISKIKRVVIKYY